MKLETTETRLDLQLSNGYSVLVYFGEYGETTEWYLEDKFLGYGFTAPDEIEDEYEEKKEKALDEE